MTKLGIIFTSSKLLANIALKRPANENTNEVSVMKRAKRK
jgi:hypothetical protein